MSDIDPDLLAFIEANYPAPLQPWQRRMLEQMFKRDHNGEWLYQHMTMQVPRRHFTVKLLQLIEEWQPDTSDR